MVTPIKAFSLQQFDCKGLSISWFIVHKKRALIKAPLLFGNFYFFTDSRAFLLLQSFDLVVTFVQVPSRLRFQERVYE